VMYETHDAGRGNRAVQGLEACMVVLGVKEEMWVGDDGRLRHVEGTEVVSFQLLEGSGTRGIWSAW